MKKFIPYIVGIVILISVLFVINPKYFQVFYSYIFNSKNDTESQPIEKENFAPTVNFKTITDSDPNGKWKFSATYPVFDSTLGKKWSAINSRIEAEVQVIKLKNIDDTADDVSSTSLPFKPLIVEITLTSDATTSSKFGTASVLFSTFVEGDLLAHPYTSFESHTFNVSDASEKQLSDFFTTTDYLNQLSKTSTNELKDYYTAQGNDDNSFLDNNDGLTASSTNFNVFMFSDNSLILQFEEYQLGARPYGAPRIEVPLSSLTTN
ncbi:MAG: RsiV family protein [bacterium]